MEKKDIDYIIVGQGIAGTILAHFLLKANQKIHIIDDAASNSSTAIAAGLINPITGRRFVKSWRLEEFLPQAKATYKELETKFDCEFYHPYNVVRAIFNAGEENDWLVKAGEKDYQPFMVENADSSSFDHEISSSFSYVEVTQSAQVEVGKLITVYRDFFKSKGIYTQEKFTIKDLEIEEHFVKYKDIQAKKIIFCEGAKVKTNPYFNYLPFLLTKGEVLIVRIPNVNFEKIIKHKLYLIPLPEKDTFWVGATLLREYENDLPSEKARKQLLEKLNKILQVPFEVIDHKSAIRPTVRDRRPFIGQHPMLKPLYLFNGMGTKGTSLTPFWANHTVQHLLENKALDKEVDIKKYERYFSENT